MRLPARHLYWLSIWVSCLVFSVICIGCASSSPKKNTGDSALVKEAVRDSLKAKFTISFVAQGKEQSFDAMMFSVPGKRYRVELMGPMGIGVAQLLWQEDGWLVAFPTEKKYLKGAGYMVGLLDDVSIPLLHIHQVASIFEGVLLPENFKDLGNGEAEEPSGRKFSYGMENGSVSWIARKGRDEKVEKLKFSNFKDFEGHSTPTHVVFERDDAKYLEIYVKSVKRGKSFGLGVWRLNIPNSFELVK